MASESTPLVSIGGHATPSPAKANAKTLRTLLGTTQLALLILFLTITSYDKFSGYSNLEYVIYRDIMVMLLLGFGYLMTFLRKYGLGAVGLTMMLTVLAMQLNVFAESFARFLYGKADSLPLALELPSLIDGEFSAATLLISYGAVIGRASPVQLVVMAICQAFFYAFNKVIIVFGLCEAEDVGGTLTIHMFGAFFGLAVSHVLGVPKSSSASNASPNRVSDVLALVGTTLLWVYWPSFVAATETGVEANNKLCVMHTILGLLGSTGATFFMSQYCKHGLFDPVHVANSTLAGGVAVGASARLIMMPGGSLLVGIIAGAVSVLGYSYVTPFLESKFNLYDTCGVGNLHGWPSVFGGLASIVFVHSNSDAEFLIHGGSGTQGLHQFMGVAGTLVASIVSGWVTGNVMKSYAVEDSEEYDDGIWWEGEYFEAEEHKQV